MYIPGSNAIPLPAAFSASTAETFSPFIVLKGGSGSGSGSDRNSEKWSSLIGVVTAICGNVLISFALNTQRYAHMRLSRDREEREEKIRLRAQSKKNTGATAARDGGAGYGTQQQEEDENRVEERYSLSREGDETEPLIPKRDAATKGRRRRSSAESSEETAKAKEVGSDGQVKEKSYLRSPIWWVGIALMTVGEAGNFLAYGFAPASLVSPLGVVALVSNCLIAPWLLHERFRWRDALGVIIAVAGCVTVVLSANDSNPKLTQDRIWKLITQWEFETYLGITVLLIIVLAVCSNKFGDKSVLIDLGLVALFGGYTALSTKGVASLLSNKIWRIITFPITYLLVAVLVSTAVMQIKYLNRALQRFNATVVIPTQFVLFTISVILGSAILYRDFERTTGQDAAEFLGGCALTFLGVWCITSGRNKASEDDEEETEDEEENIDLADEEGAQPEIREHNDGEGRKPSLISGSSASGAAFRRATTADAMQAAVSVSSTPPADHSFPLEQSPLRPPKHLVPANASAIHTNALPTEPREASAGNQDQPPPPIHTTTSLPIVPTINSSSRPQTPLERNATGPAPSPHGAGTPVPRLSLPTDNLETPAQQPPHRLISRRSMAGLIPAPFTSPLSNSLSAIVADSLRRGIDHSPVPTIKRRLTRSKSGRGGSHLESLDGVSGAPGFLSVGEASRRPKRHSIASGDMPFEEVGNLRSAAAAGAGESGSLKVMQGRMRSMSATISDIFGSGSGKRSRMESQESLPGRNGDGE